MATAALAVIEVTLSWSISLAVEPGMGRCFRNRFHHLSNELNNTAGLLDLTLGLLGEVARADDDWDLRDAALAEDLRVAEGKEVDDGCGVGLLVGDVGLAGLLGDERPQLELHVSA